MRARHLLAVALPLCLALLAPQARAGEFEGTIKMRIISVPTSNLSSLLGGKPATDSAAVLAISPEQLLSLKDKAGSDVRINDSTMYVKGSEVRVDIPGRAHRYAIMHLAQGTYCMVMPDEKRYIEWTKADLDAMQTRMGAMRKQMEEQLAKLPPAQRKQVEAMMKKNMPGGEAAPPAEVRPLGKTQTIAGMHTTAFEVRESGATTIGWVTQDRKDLMQTYGEMQQNQSKLMPGRLRHEKGVQALLAERGFPVRVQTVIAGDYRVQDLVGVKSQSLPADLFSVPAGFTKTNPHEMMRQSPHHHMGQ